MNADRRIRLWSQVTAYAQGQPVAVEHVCTAALAAAGVDSAAVTVKLSATPYETLYSTDDSAARLEELALTLGEGPGVSAVAGTLELVADLAAAPWRIRWPFFAPAAVDSGVRAVFALPLQVGGARLGVMNLYRALPGDLESTQLTDALILADTAYALLLDGAARTQSRHDGRHPEPAGPHRPDVHQATGMISVQLGVTVAVALIRLRAYAYTHDRRLTDVADDVVARRLRFPPDDRR